MAKGGGKGKGRPRKTQNLEIHTPAKQSPARTKIGECSYVAEINGMANSVKHQIEREISASVEIQTEELHLEGEKEAKAIQIEDGERLPLRNRGMQLGYIAPVIKKGIPTAILEKSKLDREAEKWKNAVIFYVIGETPTISHLSFFLQRQCEIGGKFEIFYHNEGYFVIRFELRSDRDKMIYEGPHMISSRPTIVKEWMAEFCFEKEVLREVPLWIRLPKLPLNCWSGDSLSRIGSVIGKPICADECTSQQKRISYARLLVEVNITQPLKYKVNIEGEDGKLVEQKIFYEWVPMFCQKCQMVGHICKPMEAKPTYQKQWQPKDKGKEKMEEKTEPLEKWEKPRKVSPAVIQVGNIQGPTVNTFQEIEEKGDAGDIQDTGGGHLPLTTE